MSDTTPHPSIEVVVGDIADVASHQCEAYVCAANNELWMGSGVAGALKRVAGDTVEREAVAQGPIEVGDAVITSAGAMPPPARAIIHAAAMGFTDRTQIYASPETVDAATRKALELCNANGIRSVVLPALGTGVGGLDDESCAAAMTAAVRDYLRREPSLERVRFVVTNPGRAAIFQRAIDQLRDA
ncbi:MAG TPA: macro domain-containing protein [Thermomicrobiales bacterium]|nr:macro domain-containing protein [Thermomicrobiales bacterium]